MRRLAILLSLAALAITGCGGNGTQDAEDHVRSEVERHGGALELRGLHCEHVGEGARGDRYECDVPLWNTAEADQTKASHRETVIVESDDFED